MFWVVVALLYFVLAAVAPSILGLFVNRARPDFRTLSLSLRIVFVAIALICLAATSYVPRRLGRDRCAQQDLRDHFAAGRAHHRDEWRKGSAGRDPDPGLASVVPGQCHLSGREQEGRCHSIAQIRLPD